MKVKTPMPSQENAANAKWGVKIDYLSCVSGGLHVPLSNDNPIAPTYVVSGAVSCRAVALHSLAREGDGAWSHQNGRSGYVRSSAHPIGARVFYGHPNAAPLLEMGGAACDRASHAAEILPFISRWMEGVTRLDLAGDILTDVSPEAFLSAGFSARVKSTGAHDTATGSTRYLGSPHSDRRCRVYRYHPPHPRAAFLRVEVVFRRELAKVAAQSLSVQPIAAVWSSGLHSMAFRHPLWRQPTDRLSVQPTLRNEPTSSARLRWLQTQIRPAVLEAHRSGLIDLQEWLDAAS